MATFDRKAAKKKLLKRTQEQSQKKDQGQFGSIFKRTDLPMFFPENGKHKVDIIPYLAGKHDPQVAKGDPTYLLDIWVHRGAGIGDDPYVCLAKNYKKNCPICNYRKQYEADLDEDTLKGLLPKRRTIYNVVDRTTESDRKKGVQVWEIAHFFMEKHLLAQAENPDGGGVAAYADTEEGSTVFFRKSGSKDTTTYDGHKLLPREYKIKDKILEQAFTLDELIHIPTEEELDNVVKGLKRKSKSQQADDDDDEMEDEDEEETTSKRKKSKKRDEEEDVDDSNFDDDDEDDDDEKPKKKKAKKQDDDDEDDDEEEEDEKPKKKKKPADDDEDDDEEEEKPKKKGKKGKCPAGGTFGKDFDSFDECVDCPNFDECSDKNDELNDGDDDDEEEEKPKKKGKKAKKPADDDDEDDDEEEEKPKKKKKSADDDDEDDDEEDEDEDEKPKKKKSKFNRRTGR